jgi:hypothetical protein
MSELQIGRIVFCFGLAIEGAMITLTAFAYKSVSAEVGVAIPWPVKVAFLVLGAGLLWALTFFFWLNPWNVRGRIERDLRRARKAQP